MSWRIQNIKTNAINIDSPNNITLLRHIAALFVLISHSYGLLNLNEYEPLFTLTKQINLSGIGLSIFFFLSGFLVTQSIITTKNIKHFLIKRVLRIYPALIVLILFTVFCIGPIFTKGTSEDYFSSQETWSYFVGGLTLVQIRFFLPGVFNEHGVNGSLWSLPIEFRLYILLAAVFFFGAFKRSSRYTVITLIAIAVYVLVNTLSQEIISPVIKPYLDWGIYFFLGSTAFLNRERIVLRNRYLVGLLIIWISSLSFHSFQMISNLLFYGYLTLFISFGLPAIWKKYFARNDFSYSIYIYSFVVQQSLIEVCSPYLSPGMLIMLTLLVLIPFCYFSWNYIEKPCLLLKNRFS